MIRFGSAGIGKVKEAVKNLEEYSKLGLKACEIEFTYGVYIGEDAKEVDEIRKASEKLDIQLSIHAPYWVNLNSSEKKKVEDTKKRILQCCKIGNLLGAEIIVFHPGYYGKSPREETFENIKDSIVEMQDEIKKNKWRVVLAPETMGKINVFGSLDEVLRLVKETGCFFCMDFSHLVARSLGKMKYEEMYEQVKHFPRLHCHFSGINYGEKGEKNHIVTDNKDIKELLSVLPRNKDIAIINESPETLHDAIRMASLFKKL